MHHLPTKDYLNLVRERFSAAGNPDYALQQMAYMRHQFEFFGLPAPKWVAISKEIHAGAGIPQGDDLIALVRACFDDDHREMHYFGLQTLEKTIKKQPAEAIEWLEELIQTRSWWDTVDWINKLVGIHFKRYPHLIGPVTEKWLASGNIWLQRICLIFQLTYKDKTDTDLLFDYIRRLSGSKEFFIQKAAGWALRQYAKHNPDAVADFIKNTALAPLTRREGSKYLP
ncbi:MAG: DNA alkylation repair protein [Saprospiraceae bacterium]|nr:DNA alkylation repair protein [Saprospiraceae bacterium]